jgi:hypothetical protein
LCDALGPVAVLSLIGIPFAWCQDPKFVFPADWSMFVPLIILQMVLGLLYGSFATAFLLLIGNARVTGDVLSHRQALKKAVSVWPRLLWTLVVVSFAICLGCIGLILPGIYLALRLVAADAVTVFEGKCGPRAFKRSFEMTEGLEGKILVLGIVYLGVALGHAGFCVMIESAFPHLEAWPMNAAGHFCTGVVTSFLSFYTLGIYQSLEGSEAAGSRLIPSNPEA